MTLPATPQTVTLCGSTRFPDAFALANMHLSLRGHVVIGLAMHGHADQPQGARFLANDGDETTPAKQGLDALHFRKIDMSDGIYIVYIGDSTRREIAYATANGKAVWWMFPDAVPTEFRVANHRWSSTPDEHRFAGRPTSPSTHATTE